MKFKKIVDVLLWILNTMMHRPDLFCLVAAFFVTLLKLKDGADGKLDTKMLVKPSPTVSNGSNVLDAYVGSIRVRNYLIRNKDLTIVFYYAPWCERSMNALKEFEDASGVMSKKAIFMAINCWHSGGQCRGDISISKFPQIYAHHANSAKPIKYDGPLRSENFQEFISRLTKPMSYLGTSEVFESFISNNQLTAVSTFNLTHNQHTPESFKNFTKISLQYITNYPKDYLQFGFVTNSYMTKRYKLQSEKIKLLSSISNQPSQQIELNMTITKTMAKLQEFGKNMLLPHISATGRKSDSLYIHLSKRPSLLAFLPTNIHNQHMNQMVERLVHEYNNCEEKQSNISKYKDIFSYLQNENTCHCYVPQNQQIQCSVCHSSNVYNTNVPNHYFSGTKNMPPTCLTMAPTPRNFFKISSICCVGLSTRNSPIDIQYLQYLLKNEQNIFYYHNQKTSSKIKGLGCVTNKTLSFIQMNSRDFTSVADSFNLIFHEVNGSSYGAIIVDMKNEQFYNLNQPMHQLENFILNYTFGLLTPSMKSKSYANHQFTSGNIVALNEITSDNLQKTIYDSKKDILLLYTAPWCGYCSAVNHIILSFARLISPVESLILAKIDASENDIPDSYTVDNYPSILLYLGNRFGFSKVFPNYKDINQSNLLKFVLREASPKTRKTILWNICIRQPRGSQLSHYACEKWRKFNK